MCILQTEIHCLHTKLLYTQNLIYNKAKTHIIYKVKNLLTYLKL